MRAAPAHAHGLAAVRPHGHRSTRSLCLTGKCVSGARWPARRAVTGRRSALLPERAAPCFPPSGLPPAPPGRPPRPGARGLAAWACGRPPVLSPTLAGRPGRRALAVTPRSAARGGRGGGGAPAVLETHLWGAPAWAGSALCKGWRGAEPAPRRDEGGEVGASSAVGLMGGGEALRRGCLGGGRRRPLRGSAGGGGEPGRRAAPRPWRAASRGRLGERAGLAGLPRPRSHPRAARRGGFSLWRQPFPAGWMPRPVRPASRALPWQPSPPAGSPGSGRGGAGAVAA